MTAGEVAAKAGLAPGTVSTTLSKLAKAGEVQKAERGYRLRHLLRRGEVGSSRSLLFMPGVRRYRRRRAAARLQVRRRCCDRRRCRSSPGLLPTAEPLPKDAVFVCAAGVLRAERCPRECPHCHPPFETLLTYQLEPGRRTRALTGAFSSHPVRAPLIRRSAPISPTCPTACASCDRQPGSRYGNKSSSPAS